MTLTLQQLIALSPLWGVGLTVIAVMLLIAWKRDHFLTAALSVLGLLAALFSLPLAEAQGSFTVTSLMSADPYALFYSALVLISAIFTLLFAYPWLKGYQGYKEEFYLLVLIAALGGVFLSFANHLAALFLGIELLSLPFFGLIGYVFVQKNPLEASMKYMVLSALASSFLLFGVALVYASSGALSFPVLGKIFDQGVGSPLLLAGLGLMLAGFAFKLSLAPFHLWTPDVYQGGPSLVSGFLATASKIAVFTVMLRLFLFLPPYRNEALTLIIEILAVISILFGNLMALSQTNLKRMLGYSSIAHFGYLVIALTALKTGNLAFEAVGIYLAGYLVSNLGAFGVISLLSSPYNGKEKDDLESYRGLFWYRPELALAMTVMMLSLAGIPMTLGFLGKAYILMLTVQTQAPVLAMAVVLGSALGLFYYLRVAITLYAKVSPERQAALMAKKAAEPFYTLADFSVLLCMVAVLFFGLWPQPLMALLLKTLPLLS